MLCTCTGMAFLCSFGSVFQFTCPPLSRWHAHYSSVIIAVKNPLGKVSACAGSRFLVVKVCGCCGFVMSRSRHLPVCGWHIYLCTRNRECTSVLDSEIDIMRILEVEGLAFVSFLCLAIISRLTCHHKVRWARSIDSCGSGMWHEVGDTLYVCVHMTSMFVTICG